MAVAGPPKVTVWLSHANLMGMSTALVMCQFYFLSGCKSVTYYRLVHQRFLVNDQRDAQIIFYVFIFIYNSLHVTSTLCSSSGETNFINTTSGNCHYVLVAV
jgi:hypothetical protein